MAAPWPTELRLAKDGRSLAVGFDDGARFELSAEYLRVMTGSAQDRGHSAGPRPPIPGKADAVIRDITPVGAYAVRLVFADGHDSGLYTWDLLHDLGSNRAKHWDGYLKGLEQAGMSRGQHSNAS